MAGPSEQLFPPFLGRASGVLARVQDMGTSTVDLPGPTLESLVTSIYHRIDDMMMATEAALLALQAEMDMVFCLLRTHPILAMLLATGPVSEPRTSRNIPLMEPPLVDFTDDRDDDSIILD